MIKNNRLYALAKEAKGIDTLLDIGTDHGYALKYALDKNYIKKAIAADIKEQPLNNARENLSNYPVTFVLSDGFKNVNENYDGVIIAGIGAFLMKQILDNAPQKDIIYVLQPNSNYDILRCYLQNNNFKIINETLVFENNFYYVIFKVIRGKMNLDLEDLFLGPILKKRVSSLSYYKRVLKRYIPLVNKADDKQKKDITKKISWLEKTIEILTDKRSD